MASRISQQRKTITFADTKYGYDFIPSRNNKPTLLFLHGFPSIAEDWHHQISHFSNKGYGVLAPDLLGYGASSKPSSISSYNWRDMCLHVVRLIEHENVAGRVIAIGHDLGSWMLSRFVHFYSDNKLAGVAFLDVGYSPPGDKFDVDAINRMTREMTGEEKFRYWDFFCACDGAEVADRKPASLISLLHAADPHLVAANLGPADRMRDWVEQGKEAKVGNWLSEDDLLFRVEQFKNGGFQGPFNWYKALATNTSFDDEKDMPKDLNVPVLVIGAARDEMTLAVVQKQMTEPFARRSFQFETVDAGHWVMLERFEEVNGILQDFVDRCVAK